MEVGSFLVGGGVGMNANANFFASDGVAALFTLGPACMGLLVGLLLRLVNKIVGTDDLPLAAICSSGFAFTLSELSLFTSLLTGGGFLLIVLLYLSRRSRKVPQKLTSVSEFWSGAPSQLAHGQRRK